MIAKMKKLTFLVYHKEYESFLTNLRNLGLVHVTTRAQGTAENSELQESIRLTGRYAAAGKYLQQLMVPAQPHEGNVQKGVEALEKTEALQTEIQQLSQRIQAVEKEISVVEPWGDFDPESIVRLRDAGYRMDFYQCSEKQFLQEWVDQY
ncbi:MAG: V-type ATP synthase subunit I, partial [Bacteroides sp.]|nr:V-type ATP synthase subunit I [Bacteroides sp.]